MEEDLFPILGWYSDFFEVGAIYFDLVLAKLHHTWNVFQENDPPKWSFQQNLTIL